MLCLHHIRAAAPLAVAVLCVCCDTHIFGSARVKVRSLRACKYSRVFKAAVPHSAQLISVLTALVALHMVAALRPRATSYVVLSEFRARWHPASVPAPGSSTPRGACTQGKEVSIVDIEAWKIVGEWVCENLVVDATAHELTTSAPAQSLHLCTVGICHRGLSHSTAVLHRIWTPTARAHTELNPGLRGDETGRWLNLAVVVRSALMSGRQRNGGADGMGAGGSPRPPVARYRAQSGCTPSELHTLELRGPLKHSLRSRRVRHSRGRGLQV
ncbi:hypothetical protein C8R45DRAFT_921089 [Mycena sanguinolenta]|nr:hypothetical protein C8R45DRAFT_921089 [Mycena sanguinolenta]